MQYKTQVTGISAFERRECSGAFQRREFSSFSAQHLRTLALNELLLAIVVQFQGSDHVVRDVSFRHELQARIAKLRVQHGCLIAISMIGEEKETAGPQNSPHFAQELAHRTVAMRGFQINYCIDSLVSERDVFRIAMRKRKIAV